ncbi:glycosyltransferase [Candidatus Micrarchaeota archaeon]|nr:glycosyltransferase [Candidatus Micrarchaeota archaeon]
MLSIVIPTLNEKDNVDRLLSHLTEQMEDGDEIIIVDAYSKDGTPDIALRHGAKVVFQKPVGIGLAKTEGAKHAKNSVLVFLDADCIPAGDFLKKMKSHFKRKDVHAVGGLDLYESDSALWKFLYDTYSTGVFYSAALMHKLTGKYWIAANNAAYRKNLFFSVGGFRSVICEDTDMMQRLPPSKKVKYDPELVLTLSDRRFRENGFFRTLGLWLWSNVLIFAGKGAPTGGYRKG